MIPKPHPMGNLRPFGPVPIAVILVECFAIGFSIAALADHWSEPWFDLLARIIGLACLVLGLVLFTWAQWRFLKRWSKHLHEESNP